MKNYKNQEFIHLHDRGGRLKLFDMHFDSCVFDTCLFSLTDELSNISYAKNISIQNCTILACHFGPSVVSNLYVKNLKTDDLAIFWSPYLEKVVFEGPIGKIKINKTAGPTTFGNEKQIPFDEYRDRFYQSTEWALDISKARFREFDAKGVPGHLIRRDPESQILIKRERALEIAKPGWEKLLEPTNKLWPFMIKLFLSDGDADTVLVAPLGAPKAKRDPLLRGIKELREIGLAEPD